ncbi:MAG: arsenate reductase ArsC ['Candidatus Kapabacteria' thiocyanatum]|mgnify:CR=1 FL=1|uniref:Protein-tyrosine-phosphatase n=1 Tax=Candidatus Kapaibacterium thiocyanatum TaxID=1895771 RepID=A0A1M3KZ10_9BACT|nr:arsenate reductase ArsC ['Candidatus Kapabacteria' thiocyanatum]OJX57719.1 MAG: protein-tyrosine-phosphatase ['Candidatus Kapabacteria' thiocyanatum]
MTIPHSHTVGGEHYNVLILCTGNSARSIMAEAIFNTIGKDRFTAFSAGSHPTGIVNPFALELCRTLGYPTESLRSKGWDEFALPGAPAMDFIITVCDRAGGEVCPIWPGTPMTFHWGFEDPAAVHGTDTEKMVMFDDIFNQIMNRVRFFMSLPLASLDELSIRKAMDGMHG